MILIVGITGATGAVYGIRLLEVLKALQVETHLVISEAGTTTINYETKWKVEEVQELADHCYRSDDLSARISSGSFKTDGMIVAPCTIKTMSALANSYSDNLITRAGDVTLKERRRLVLAVRETPLHLGHLMNMQRLTQMGAIIMPPVPAFYCRPRTLEDLVDHSVGKMLDMFDIKHELFARWDGVREWTEND